MKFDDVIKTVADTLSKIGTTINTGDYDGVIVKRLEASNTLDKGRTTKQSHIAITGSQMDMFPYLRADGYFTEDYDKQDPELKKYMVAQIPAYLHKENVDYLGAVEKLFDGDSFKAYISIVRSRRNDAADQIQMSMTYMDSPEYVAYRRIVHTGSCMIMLKRRSEFEYDLYCVKPEDSQDLAAFNNVFVKLPTNTAVKTDEMVGIKRNMKTSPATNILLYGVPGCGKSHTIKTQYCDDDNYMERAVFHPDYTYSDFIGQILPKVTDHKVSYEFEPGPFTRILKKAADPENKDNYYYLVIEEINRGNAPAIFGDVFQLLDRDSNGVSEYGVSNEAVAEVVYGDKDHRVKIPSNLFILATMNSSDQNVFTLDTAFKRRWKMKLIENDVDACKYASHSVCGTSVTWAAFAKRINDLIIEVKTDNLSNEDNRLGAYFVSESELDDADAFGEKVLMYLWNDAFKYDHEKVFKTQYRTLDELIKGFKDTGFSVFADNVKFPESTEDDDEAIDFTLDSGSGEIQIERYLSGKKDHLIEYYKRLLDVVKKDVPDLRDATVGSLQYASWRAPGLSKVSFADIKIRKDRIVIFTEQPSGDGLQDIGEVLPVNNHRNHYFKIIYTGDRTDDVASAIVESYEKLKVN
jgi:hypothetical protein